MENRVIKFRVWDTDSKIMFDWPDVQRWMFDTTTWECYNFLQFTGKKCFKGREVYEGDVLFYEDQTDEGDKRYYLVVTYIQEWCMFATLHLDEYHKYLREGAKALDEFLYWTYPIEESEDYHYAGNVFEHPHLLEPKKEEKQ